MPEYTESDYKRERKICDRAEAYVREIMQREGRNYLTAEEGKARIYRACDNAMRGRVEQFEILRDLPDRFVAYLENGKPDMPGARLNVTTWPSNILGQAWVYTIGRRASRFGDRQRYGRARIGGRLYAWQGPGAGMYARFRAIKG